MKEPSPSPFNLFFCFRSNFRATTRLETLATQATMKGRLILAECHSFYLPVTQVEALRYYEERAKGYGS